MSGPGAFSIIVAAFIVGMLAYAVHILWAETRRVRGWLASRRGRR